VSVWGLWCSGICGIDSICDIGIDDMNSGSGICGIGIGGICGSGICGI
jgi:hypothetical protein